MWRILFFTLVIHSTNIFAQETLAPGQMPNVATDESKIHIVYGRGDSVIYKISKDLGKTFSEETVVSVLPGLAASHTRGPQIAITNAGIVITACTSPGNIFSFLLNDTKTVVSKMRVNDVDTIAKENLMALGADGNNVFAAWLDLRNGRNQIYGAASHDGGKTWSKNIRVYASPDSTVCECCKPSVVVKGTNIYVMFRNWLDGNRDLYVAKSVNNGQTFNDPAKVGYGQWKLSGCPMDGGAISVVKDESVKTVFNRDGAIYACTLGMQETKLGSGRNCTLDASNDKAVYAWVENGNIVYINSNKIKTSLGKGQLPILKVINSKEAICFWEVNKQIMKAIVKL